MDTAALKERIDSLERRVRDLESRHGTLTVLGLNHHGGEMQLLISGGGSPEKRLVNITPEARLEIRNALVTALRRTSDEALRKAMVAR